MKRLLLCLLLGLGLSAAAFPVSLQWSPNAASDQVLNYTVYQATASGGPFAKIGTVLPATCSATVCTYQLTGLTQGVYFFYVTATNVWVPESGPSNTVLTPSGPSSAPKNLIIIATIGADGTIISIKVMTPEDFFRTS